MNTCPSRVGVAVPPSNSSIMFRQALRSLPRLARATAAGRLEAAQGVSSRRAFSSWSRSALATLVVAGAAASAAATGASLAESPVESSVLVPSIPERAQERTFIMVKPDGVQRGLVSDILGRFEKRGYKLVAIKVVLPTSDLAQKHYAEHEGKSFYPKLVDFLSSGPVVAMVFEGRDAVATGRTMIGASDPIKSAPGTIRADLGVDLGRNVIHGSDGLEAAAREINLWFPEGVVTYGITNQGWIYE